MASERANAALTAAAVALPFYAPPEYSPTLTAGITEQEFGSLHQQVAGHNTLDTAKCSCSLSLVGEDIGASGSFLLSHTSSKPREPLTVSTV